MNTPEHTIGGGWLGTYAYDSTGDSQAPVRFEATWTVQGDGGRFLGPVLDDGPLGEATTDGMQTGRQVAFTKVYVERSSSYTHPVAYEGTLSEDGTQVAGTWRLADLSGTWDARRAWSHEARTEHAEAGAEAGSVRTEARTAAMSAQTLAAAP